MRSCSRLTPGRQIDDEQAGLAAFLGQHNRVGGNHAIHHRHLTPLSLPPETSALNRLSRDRTDLFAAGNRADDFAGDDLGQISRLLRIAASQQHAFGKEIDAGGKGRRRHRAAQFFGDAAEFEIAKAQPAMLFGNGSAGPALLDDRCAHSSASWPLEPSSISLRTRSGRAFGGEELARLVLQGLLFVREIEIHIALLVGRALFALHSDHWRYRTNGGRSSSSPKFFY
jgi:hypothetical protein